MKFKSRKGGLSTLVGLTFFITLLLNSALLYYMYFNEQRRMTEYDYKHYGENVEVKSVSFGNGKIRIQVENKGSDPVEIVGLWIIDSLGHHYYNRTTSPSFSAYLDPREIKTVTMDYAWDGRPVTVKIVSLYGRTYLYKTGGYWWNPSYSARKPIAISNAEGDALTDYQICLNVAYESEMQTDFSDLRFTYRRAGEESEIPYWIGHKIDGTLAIVWVKIPRIDAKTVYTESNTTYFMYYGNPSALSKSDGDSTFTFFDDYRDSSKWKLVGYTLSLDVVARRLIVSVDRSGDDRAKNTDGFTLPGNPPSSRLGYLIYGKFNLTTSGSSFSSGIGVFSSEGNLYTSSDAIAMALSYGKCYLFVKKGGSVYVNASANAFTPITNILYNFALKREGKSLGLKIWTTDPNSPEYEYNLGGVDLAGRSYSVFQFSNINDGGSGDAYILKANFCELLVIRSYQDPEPAVYLGSEEAL